VAIPLEKSTVGPPWKNSFRRSCSVGLFASKNPNGFQQLRGSVGSTPTHRQANTANSPEQFQIKVKF